MNWLKINFERQSSLVGFTISHHSHTYWHSCGIEPPKTCPYDISPTITGPVECSNREQFGQFLSEYNCAPLPWFLSEAKSCAPLFDLRSEYCALKDGRRCEVLLYYSNLTDKLYTRAFQECPRTRDFCTVNCKTTLQSLHDHAGCCLYVDNGTDPDSIVRSILRYGLWRSCGIEPPGQCPNITQPQSGSGFPVVSSSSVMITVFLIITLFCIKTLTHW